MILYFWYSFGNTRIRPIGRFSGLRHEKCSLTQVKHFKLRKNIFGLRKSIWGSNKTISESYIKGISFRVHIFLRVLIFANGPVLNISRVLIFANLWFKKEVAPLLHANRISKKQAHMLKSDFLQDYVRKILKKKFGPKIIFWTPLLEKNRQKTSKKG